MSTAAFKFLAVASLLSSLACHAPSASAQRAPGAAERLHANAVASFRQARFAEAYGRFIGLADAGHAPSAELALWMYQNGPTLFGTDWDVSPDQLTAWARLAGLAVPMQVERVYPRALAPVAMKR